MFQGTRDRATGPFLTVLWENFGDPIFTGREELGFSKIYCELPEPTVLEGTRHCIATWDGFRFMDMNLTDLKQRTAEEIEAAADDAACDGMLHYKYIPRTGEWGTADASYPVMTPADTPNRVVKERWEGEGTVQFHKAAWEDLPTTYHIVNAFADLEIKECRGASFQTVIGAKDLSDQRILE